MIVDMVFAQKIQSIEYHLGLLLVRFNPGGLYAFYDVPQRVYGELIAAKSRREYIKTEISGRFKDKRIA